MRKPKKPNKPSAPKKPEKTLQILLEIFDYEILEDEYLLPQLEKMFLNRYQANLEFHKPTIDEGFNFSAKDIKLKIKCGYSGPYTEEPDDVIFYIDYDIVNPDYDSDTVKYKNKMNKHKEKLQIYKGKLNTYNKDLALYNQEQSIKEDKSNRKLYEQLKKQFEPTK